MVHMIHGDTTQSMMDGRDISDQNVNFVFFKMGAGGNFNFFSSKGRRWPFWMSEIHFCLYFSPFQIKTQHSFFFQNGCWRPFWTTEINFHFDFSQFLIKTQLSCFFQNGHQRPFWTSEILFSIAFLAILDKNATFIFFFKMATGGHF